MRTIERIMVRHKREITALQESCFHYRLSAWSVRSFYGHSEVCETRVCKKCGKVVRERILCSKCGKLTESFKSGNGKHYSRPSGKYFCRKCYRRTPKEIAGDRAFDKGIKKFILSNRGLQRQ